MSHFLYFLPHETPAVDSKKIAEAGLAHAFESPPIRGAVASGPDGNPGALLSASGPEKIGFHPDKQTWKRFPRGAAWVGFYNEDPPTPAELQRKGALGGHPLELLDGREWIVPLARQFRDEGETFRFLAALPQSVVLNDQDEWVSGGVLPRYQKIWELACDWYDSRINAQIEKVEGEEQKIVLKFEFVADVIESAIAALAVNYRVGRVEVAALGLLSVDLAHAVLDALVDFPTLLEWSKKNLVPPDSSPTTAG